MTDASTVVVRISPSGTGPEIYFMGDELDIQLSLSETVFLDSGLGHWMGFYDWLRTSSGVVIGVRSWADLPREIIAQWFIDHPHIEWKAGDSTCIWFTEERQADEDRSSDQSFGIHRLLTSAESEVALQFEVDGLSGTEVGQLAHLSVPR